LTDKYQLVSLSKKVFNGPVLRHDLATLCVELKVEPQVLLRPVATRWNSLVPVIRQAIELKKPLARLCGLPQHNTGRSSTHLVKHYPTPEEWRILEELKPMLEVCYWIDFNLKNILIRFNPWLTGF
jgi:hypothetical protein